MKNEYYFLAFATAVIFVLMSTSKNYKIKDITNDLPKNGKWGKRSLSGIEDITIHHSAGATSSTPYDFAVLHIDWHNWPGIAYHYVIDYSGQIFQTNDLDSKTYHNGFNNTLAIGVCLIGDFTKIQPSTEQLKAAQWLCKNLTKEFKNIDYIMGHKEYANATLCPGSFPIEWLRKSTKKDVRPTANNTGSLNLYNNLQGDN